ncbi:MAG TPA: hypothetical protein VMK65_11125, partial [Longimicrobiales bacterium]|nr:hypothetical protein [Longimicrobiales bacterium]
HVAARYGAITFSDHPAGANHPDTSWDYDARRIQVGAGWQPLRNAGIKAEYMRNHTERHDPNDDLASVQLWWAF